MFLKKTAAVMIMLFLCLGGAGVSHAATSGSSPTVSDMFKNQQQKSKTPSKSNKVKSLGTGTQPSTPVVSGGQTNIFFILLKLVGALGIVILLIYFLYKMVSKKTKAFHDDGSIHNVGGVSVGANRSVQLVKIGEEILVLGIGDNVELLKEINDPSLIESLTRNKADAVPLSKNVKKLVDWTKERTGYSRGSSNESSDGFKQQLGKALKETKQARTKAVEALKRKGGRDE